MVVQIGGFIRVAQIPPNVKRHASYHIFWTICRTFFHSLAGPATYSQVRLIYQNIYNLTLLNVNSY